MTCKNEATDIAACLESLLAQSCHCEIIVVDNGSSDGTAEIASKFDVLLFQKGPERSAQRNYGVRISKGKNICFIDADMIAPPNMVAECMELIRDPTIGAVVIPEESFGEGFWTRCKILERSCYPPGAYIEAARFYRESVFEELGGFDEELTGLEDLDLHQRCLTKFRIAHSKTPIVHHEGHIRFFMQLRKKFYYGKNSWKYAQKHPGMFRKQGNPFRSYFLKSWRVLLQKPILSMAMLFLKSCELLAGGIGVLIGRLKNSV